VIPTETGPGVPSSPYRGLNAYAEADAPFFFARDRERRTVVASLDARPLTVLFGPSGVGKSSLLSAGVAADLRDRARTNLELRGEPELAVAVFRTWSGDPVVGLAHAVRAAVAQSFGEGEPAMTAPAGASLTDVFAEATARAGELYLILDQVDEYFLYNTPEDGVWTLAAELGRALARNDVRPRVLLSIREDALGALDRFTPLLPGVFQGLLRIEHLDLAGARAAILRPLESYNRAAGTQIQIEDPLVDAILEESMFGGVEPGSTRADRRIEAAYLQLVMQRLWDEELQAGSSTLRYETFQRLGGAVRISRGFLDEALAFLAPDEQEIASDAFRLLVTPSGAKVALGLSDLADYVGRPIEELEPVLEKLAAARIVRRVAGLDVDLDPRFEIFHDLLGPAILDWRARRAAERSYAERYDLAKRYRLALAACAVLAVIVVALAVLAAR